MTYYGSEKLVLDLTIMPNTCHVYIAVMYVWEGTNVYATLAFAGFVLDSLINQFRNATIGSREISTHGIETYY